MITLHRGKLLLLTLFLILALSHPYLESNPHPIVKITVVKRDFIAEPEISSQDKLSGANALTENKTQETVSEENAFAGSSTQETQETPVSYYSGEQSDSLSTYEWATLPFVSFVGYTLLLHQIIGDV